MMTAALALMPYTPKPIGRMQATGGGYPTTAPEAEEQSVRSTPPQTSTLEPARSAAHRLFAVQPSKFPQSMTSGT